MAMLQVPVLFALLISTTYSTLLPDQLKVENLILPQAVNSPNPRLSWILEGAVNARNLSQTGYEIVVASKLTLLRTSPDLWNSTKVASDSTFNVRYQGIALKPGQTAFWTVRVWNQNGTVSQYAQYSSWGNAFNATNWTAQWIGAPAGLQKNATVNLTTADATIISARPGLKPVLYFRKNFLLSSNNISEAKLYVTARGLYRVFLNSNTSAGYSSQSEVYSNQGILQLSPGWTDYNKTLQYQAFNVTKFITGRNNTIGVMVGTGWYSGYVGMTGGYGYYGNNESLLLELHVNFTNGTQTIIRTDNTWKVTTGPLIYSDILQGELVYENRSLVNWTYGNYIDNNWSTVVTESLNKSMNLVADPSPEITLIGSLVPVKSWNLSADTWIYDFGVNFAGYVNIRTNAANVTIQVRHGEAVYPNNTLYTANLRTARAIDKYVLQNVVQLRNLSPHFTYHGFRYIEITGLTVNMSQNLSAVQIGVRGMISSSFITDNAMINKLQQNIIRSQYSCLISVAADNAQKDDRLGWTGDVHVYAPTGIYNGDLAGFYTKALNDIRDAQSSEGGYSDVAPRLVRTSDGSPGFGDAGIILTYYIYKYYGDLQIIQDNYNAMARWLNYIAANNTDFIWRNRLNSNYGDFLSINATTPSELLATAYWAYDALLMSKMAAAIGNTADATLYSVLNQNITKAFNGAFVNSSTSLMTGDTQSDYAFALSFGLLSNDLIPKAVQLLVTNIQNRNYHFSTGFVGIAYLLPILSANNRSDIAYRLLFQESYPSWFNQLLNNATSIWEQWDGMSNVTGFHSASTNSLNQYVYGSIGQWFFQHMAGIDMDPSETAFKHIIIKPNIGTGVNYTSATYNSIRGRISSTWWVANKTISLVVSIPPNTKATIILPVTNVSNTVGSGVYSYTINSQ